MALIPGALGAEPVFTNGVQSKTPLVTITLEPLMYQAQLAGFGLQMTPYSATFQRPPSFPLSAAIATGGITSVTGTGATPTGGSAATGTPSAPAANTTVPALPASSTIPTNVPPLMQSRAVNIFYGFTIRVITKLGEGDAEDSATATLVSSTGSSYGGRKVPLNGFFEVRAAEILDSDRLSVMVTSKSGSSVSNQITFTVLTSTLEVAGNIAGYTSETINLDSVPLIATTDHVYFAASNAAGVTKLFRTSRTTNATTQVTNLSNNDFVSDLSAPLATNGTSVYFHAVLPPSTTIRKLLKLSSADTITIIGDFQGSLATDDVIANIGLPPFGENGFALRQPLYFNNHWYFTALISGGFRKLFRLNLTTEVITRVSNTTPGGNDVPVTSTFTVFNGALYGTMTSAAATGSKLFKVTSADVITQISNTTGSSSTSDTISLIGQTAANLYFRANTTGGVGKLFKVNTSDVVTQVSGISGSQSVSDSINDLGTGYNGSFYFAARSQAGSTFRRLYRFDETSGTVIAVSNLVGTPSSDTIGDGIGTSFIKALSDGVYFAGTGGSSGSEKVFKVTAGDVVTQVTNILLTSDVAIHIFEASGNFYLVSRLSGGPYKLFQLVGTQAFLLYDFGGIGSDITATYPLVNIGSSWYFRGSINGITKLLRFTP